MKIKSGILSVLITVIMIMGLTPARVWAVETGSPDDISLRGPTGSGNYQHIYYGGNRWRILGKSSGELVLLTEGMVGSGRYSSSSANYYNSEIRSWLNNSFINSFTPSEQSAMNPNTNIGNDKVYLLSTGEAQNSAYFPRGNEDRQTGSFWWTCSQYGSSTAWFVFYDGSFQRTSASANNGIRPEISLNPAAILCAAAATDSTPVTVGSSSLAAVTTLTGDMKLTVADAAQTLNIGDVTADNSSVGSVVTVNYSNATTGASNFLCAEITIGGTTYRGAVKALAQSSDASGAAIFNLPVAATAGYKLRLWNEQYNGQNSTNYASIPVTKSIIYANPAVLVSPNDEDGGSVTGGGVFTDGAPVTVTATPKNHWRFVNWTEQGTEVSTDLTYSFTLGSSDRALVANFEHITHSVAVSVNGPSAGCSVSGGGVYNEDSSVTVTATVSSGYSFVNWTENGTEVSTDPSYTFTLGTSDRSLVATINELPPEIAADTVPTGIIGKSYGPLVLTALYSLPTYTWSVTKLPAGLTMSNDGTISGIPTETGNFNLTVTVTNGENETDAKDFMLTIFDNPSVYMANLTVNPGTLSPSFDRNVVAYSINTSTDQKSIDITAQTTDSTVALAINNQTAVSGAATTVALKQGANLIPIVITSPEGLSQKAYVISVNGFVNNANLKSLAVNGQALSPAFSINQTDYNLSVGTNVDSLELSAAADDPKALTLVDGSLLSSPYEKTLRLDYGSNSIEVMVVAQDASTKTYTINVSREYPSITWNTGTLEASNISATGLTLTWPAAICNAGISGYKIYRENDLICTAAGSIFSCNVSGLMTGTSHNFNVKAMDTGGNLSSPLSVTVNTRGSKGAGKYNIIPETDAAYTIGETADGIKTMTVNSAVTGFHYFTVNVSVAQSHAGAETAVFVQIRNGVQIAINAVTTDFDQINSTAASFEVKPGDVIKVYIVDGLNNTSGVNPTVL